jgi:hypothetical protein
MYNRSPNRKKQEREREGERIRRLSSIHLVSIVFLKDSQTFICCLFQDDVQHTPCQENKKMKHKKEGEKEEKGREREINGEGGRILEHEPRPLGAGSMK